MAVIIDKYNRILKERDAELEEGAKILFERYQMDKDTPPLAKKIYAFVLLYKEIFEEYDVDVISSECWTSMQLGVGAMPCTAYSILADMGYIVSCESDMHGAISMALLSCAALGKNPPFFVEFTVRHPEDKNVELLWHCGPFAYSLKKPGTVAREENQRQWFQVKDGQFTICRFDQDDGRYQLLNGTLESADGPYTFGTYLWARFNDLTKWERKLIDGPYIHHMAVPRLYRRTDYIPCILWGRTALAAAEYPTGTELTLTGRLQSRTYLKNLGETSETRTAYELSVSACERVPEFAIF